MNYVNFNRQKDRAFATSADADPNTIYFTSDTNEIIIRGVSYSVEGTNYTNGDNINIDSLNQISAIGYTYGTTTDSFAEGNTTTASGQYSHAEGSTTKAVGLASHSEGYGTTTSNEAEHAEGKFNLSNSDPDDFDPSYQTISSIGIGTNENDRKNAFEVMQNGDTYLIGVGDYNGANAAIANTDGYTSTTLQWVINSKAEKSDLLNYLPLTGGTMTGDIIMGAGDVNIVFEEGGSISSNGQVCVDGNILIEGDAQAIAFYEISDARKKDIKSDLSLNKCYDLIDKCQTVIYSLKDQTKEQVGMIAQEIEQFFPEVVATDEEGFKSLAYDRLVVICFKVLKDIIKRLNHIENIL